MSTTDRFGLPLTTGSAEAAARYIAAVDLLLSANLGAEEQLELAVAADPDFAGPHRTSSPAAAPCEDIGGQGGSGAGKIALRRRDSPGATTHRRDRIGRRRGCGRGIGDGSLARVGVSAGRAPALPGSRGVWPSGLQRTARPSRGAIGAARRIGVALG